MTTGSLPKDDDDMEQALLEGLLGEASGAAPHGPQEPQSALPLPSLAREVAIQGRISAPMAVGLVANYLLSVISLSFVGRLGVAELAAASLATTLYSMSAKVMLAGMLGALDTYASQAVGARNFSALGSMFKQAVLFLMLHTVPIACVFASLPELLLRLGQPADVTRLLGPYLLALLPGVWIDAVYRPFNRILVAQHVSLPQMWISCGVAALHVPTTHAFVHVLGLGYVGAAYATVWSSLLATLLVAAYVQWSGLHHRVWRSPNGVVFQPWKPYIQLSYSACAMRAIESWSLSLCSVAAGWLPNPAQSLAAMAVAFSIYGTAQMIMGSMLTAACTRVGNGLGANQPRAAKQSALAAAVSVPPLWAAIAVLLLVPQSQAGLISIFTSDSDPELLAHMRRLMRLLALLLLCDMSQSVLSGVACGAGKQTRGFAINTSAHWGLGLPCALLLGFHFQLGVEGLYGGAILGPLAQWAAYSWLTLRMDWGKEAHEAHARQLQFAESIGGAGI